jgi:hypothetical protein
MAVAMKPALWLAVLWILLLAAGTRPAAAQRADTARPLVVSDTVYDLRLRDGSALIGRITAVDGDTVTVLTSAGIRIAMARAEIRSIAPVRGRVRDGEVWLEDPNSTRLFFGPTGRSLRAGEGYVGAFELFFPFVAVGITDRITLAGGTPIIPGAFGRVWYAAPKVEVLTKDRLHLSTGLLALADLTDSGSEMIGILYGAGSWGDPDNSVTAGAGWAFSGEDVAHRPVLMAGGETRVSGRVKLITENYLFTYEDSRYDPSAPGEYRYDLGHVALMSFGLRILGERLSGDLGLGFGVGADDFGCCLPLANFVYNFGSRR